MTLPAFHPMPVKVFLCRSQYREFHSLIFMKLTGLIANDTKLYDILTKLNYNEIHLPLTMYLHLGHTNSMNYSIMFFIDT